MFVAGTIGNTDSAVDFVIMKIDGRSSRKHVLWTRVIDGLGYDFYLMKFTGDGQDAWPAPRIISGTAPDGLNAATGVGILPNGDIAVTGWITNAGTDANGMKLVESSFPMDS